MAGAGYQINVKQKDLLRDFDRGNLNDPPTTIGSLNFAQEWALDPLGTRPVVSYSTCTTRVSG